jgi:hypothetical protein
MNDAGVNETTDAKLLSPETQAAVLTAIGGASHKVAEVLSRGGLSIGDLRAIHAKLGSVQRMLSEIITSPLVREGTISAPKLRQARTVSVAGRETCKPRGYTCFDCGALLLFAGRSASERTLAVIRDCRQCKAANVWTWGEFGGCVVKHKRADIQVAYTEDFVDEEKCER